jgi:hypothetical protein
MGQCYPGGVNDTPRIVRPPAAAPARSATTALVVLSQPP